MFELLDIKWGTPTFGTPSGMINWSADLSSLPTGTGVTEADLDAALNAAFSRWEEFAAVDFNEVSSGADVTITGSSLGPTYAGLATFGPVVSGLNTIDYGLIEFNSDPGFNWSPNGGGGSVDFYAVALHEIGHIMGLAHTSDPTQIMHDVVSAKDLNTGDILGAQFIYGTDPGDTRIDLSSSSGGGGGGGGALGLLLGLLALVVGLFTGGAGGAVAMAAAAKVPDFGGDEDGDVPDFLPLIPMDEGEFALEDGDGEHVQHYVLAEGFSLPMIESTAQPMYEDEDEEFDFDAVA